MLRFLLKTELELHFAGVREICFYFIAMAVFNFCTNRRIIRRTSVINSRIFPEPGF